MNYQSRTDPKPGATVPGRVANRLPVGSVIRYAHAHPTSPIDLTKVEATTEDPGWSASGQPPWGIDLNAEWLIVSIPDEPTGD